MLAEICIFFPFATDGCLRLRKLKPFLLLNSLPLTFILLSFGGKSQCKTSLHSQSLKFCLFEF